jgi:hypothetical protein
MRMRLCTDKTFLGGILDFETEKSWWKMTREVAVLNRMKWRKHCCYCWFGQKWPSNRIKNDSRIFEHPQDGSSSDSKRGFGKEKVVCMFCSTVLDTWAKGKSSHILPRYYRDGRCKQIFLNKIITGDESWCFVCDPETKRQISKWVGEISPRSKKLQFQRSRIKSMLIIFSDLMAWCTKNLYQKGEE